MILREVILENFGLYRSRVAIDLAPRHRGGIVPPVVLVGGENGAGKTTLLEAVRLSLYGRRSLGARVSQSEYEQYLRAQIHRPLNGTPAPAGAAVGIVFDYAEEGRVRTYKVRRAWQVRGNSVMESLTLEQDGTLVEDIPRDEWHVFLQDLIPPGVSQLFFFDGEKIQELAADEHDNAQLAEAIRGLLGIELVTRLRTDLGLYVSRSTRVGGDQSVAELEQVTRSLDVLDEQLAEMYDTVAELNTRRESTARGAERARNRFVSEGGDIALRRGEIQSELAGVDREVREKVTELRDLANGLLPFAIAPRLTEFLLLSLRDASERAEGAKRKTVVANLRTALELWKERRTQGAPELVGSWGVEHWGDLNSFLTFWSAVERHPSTTGVLLQEAERDALVNRLEVASRDVRPRLVSLSNTLDSLTSRQRTLQATLLKADVVDGDVLLDELREAERQLGAIVTLYGVRQEEFARLQAQRVALAREKERVLEALSRSGRAKDRSRLAANAIDALGKYEQRLLTSKLDIVRREFLRCMRHLARKSEFIADAQIDPLTCAVTLLASNGSEVPKSALSAGEKQIYATAMLWALARASGRPLPMLIDTPLARLDAAHRENLLTRYFPIASHQVIMLSTDTEVDRRAMELLEPAISHSYRLEYDPVTGATNVAPGYFWAETNKDHAIRETSRIS